MLWNARDIEHLGLDVSRVLGEEEARKTEIILTPVQKGHLFRASIKCSEEHREVVTKMAEQQII